MQQNRQVVIINYKRVSMRNLFYWSFMILGLIGFLMFTYEVFFKEFKQMFKVIYSFDLGAYCIVLAIMLEYRQNVSKAQKQHNQMVIAQGLLCIVLLTIANVIFILLS